MAQVPPRAQGTPRPLLPAAAGSNSSRLPTTSHVLLLLLLFLLSGLSAQTERPTAPSWRVETYHLPFRAATQQNQVELGRQGASAA